MKKLLRLIPVLILAVAISASCTENKGNESGDVPPVSNLTPDQHKAKLESIGKVFTGYFKPEESSAALKSLDLFYALYSGNYDYSEPVDGPATPVAMLVKSMRSTLRDHNPAALMEAVTRAAMRHSIADELGSNGMTFTYNPDPDVEDWDVVETEERAITFKYDDPANPGTLDSELKLVYSELCVDYTYKPDNSIFEVPVEVEATLTVNGKLEIALTVEPNLSTDGLTLKPEAKLIHGDLVCTAKGDANPSFISLSGEIVKGGVTIVSTYMKVLVSDMTDPENWIYDETDDYGDVYQRVDPSEHFVDYVKTGECSLQLLTAKIVGQGDIRKIIDETQKIEESWTQAGAEAETAIFNDNMKFYLTYTDDNTRVADLVTQVAFEEYDGEKEYYSEQVLQFGDGSKVAFESYFTEKRFSSLIESIETLIQGYENILR